MSDPMITSELVRLDVRLGADKTEVIRGLASVAADAGRTSNVEGLLADALAREETSSTGLPGGIAIPHCRTEHVDVPTLVFARLSPGVDFGATDGPADLAFLIAAPAGGDATHLEVLTQLARALVKPAFTNGLRQARTTADVLAIIDDAVQLPGATARPTPAPAASAAQPPTPAPAATPRHGAARADSSPKGTTVSDPMITSELVRLDVSLGADKTEVIRGLASVAADAGRTGNVEGLLADALAREETSSTGLPGGIAIPHCRTEHVDVPTLVFARLSPGVDFGAKDGPADLAFLIAAPAGGDATHLEVLTQLARALVKPAFTNGLREAQTTDDVLAIIDDAVQLPGETAKPAPAPAAAPAAGGGGDGAASAAAPAASTAAPAASPSSGPRRSVVAVTACPTGIAHTYMAAESLEAAAERAGVDITVETQGSAGAKPLSRETIAAADAAIFAADVGVRDRARFAGKPFVASGVKRAIDDGDGLIRDALHAADDPQAPRVEGAAAEAGGSSAGKESFGLTVRRILMTGVSYMIPFVAAGGLLIALSFLLGGFQIVTPGQEIATNNSLFNLPDLEETGLERALFGSSLMAYLGAVMFTLGGAAFGFLVPALAGYIAYAIADRPGIAPGFVMGAIAGTLNSGFLGGIIGGVLAGVVAQWISRWRVPVWARGLMPVVVIPLLATLISGAIMIIVLGRPLGQLMASLNDGLESLAGGSAVILGVVLGLMMAFDMGGPLNKTAYVFAITGLGAAATATGDAPQLKVMAAVMLAGMVPPLALALATFVRKSLFTPAERENGKAAGLLGISFITEGAIPFAAADPLRVIPSIMLGSAITGAIAMGTDVTLRAPHGGIFVLFAVDQVVWFFVALIVGTVVAAASVIALKQFTESKEEIEELAEVRV